MTMCSAKKSLEIAEKFDVLQRYPAPGKARAAIAEMVQELCPTDKAADALFREILEAYNTWPGPQEFMQFARGKVRPQAQRAELRDWNPGQWKHELECYRCGDDGYVAVAGEFKLCTCDAGSNMDPRFLKLLNDTASGIRDLSSKPNGAGIPVKPSARDIAAVMGEKRARSQKS